MLIKLVCLVLTFQCAVISSLSIDYKLYKKLEREMFHIKNKLNISEREEAKVDGLFRQKCMENDAKKAQETITQAYEAREDLKNCFRSLINFTVIAEEIRSAPMGELNMVFHQYCAMTPLLRECTTNFTSIMQPCLNEGIHESINNIQITLESIIELICKREADVIGLFLQDRGPECLRDKRDAVYRCYNRTLGTHIPDKLSAIPDFRLGIKECTGLVEFQRCTVQRLQKCEERTAANLLEVMMRVLWTMTPCYQLTDRSSGFSEEMFNYEDDYPAMSQSVDVSDEAVETVDVTLSTDADDTVSNGVYEDVTSNVVAVTYRVHGLLLTRAHEESTTKETPNEDFIDATVTTDADDTVSNGVYEERSTGVFYTLYDYTTSEVRSAVTDFESVTMTSDSDHTVSNGVYEDVTTDFGAVTYRVVHGSLLTRAHEESTTQETPKEDFIDVTVTTDADHTVSKGVYEEATTDINAVTYRFHRRAHGHAMSTSTPSSFSPVAEEASTSVLTWVFLCSVMILVAWSAVRMVKQSTTQSTG